MTLRDKFKKCKDASNSYYVLPIADDAEQLEKIADDYAIEVLNWYISKSSVLSIKYIGKTSEELLQIFKKEKGL